MSMMRLMSEFDIGTRNSSAKTPPRSKTSSVSRKTTDGNAFRGLFMGVVRARTLRANAFGEIACHTNVFVAIPERGLDMSVLMILVECGNDDQVRPSKLFGKS